MGLKDMLKKKAQSLKFRLHKKKHKSGEKEGLDAHVGVRPTESAPGGNGDVIDSSAPFVDSPSGFTTPSVCNSSSEFETSYDINASFNEVDLDDSEVTSDEDKKTPAKKPRAVWLERRMRELEGRRKAAQMKDAELMRCFKDLQNRRDEIKKQDSGNGGTSYRRKCNIRSRTTVGARRPSIVHSGRNYIERHSSVMVRRNTLRRSELRRRRRLQSKDAVFKTSKL
ncbi:hypothetical protein CAPTEDRAFT_218575 [Capitella teleta]|uniref:Uncharacterized protein n=1 Tax=Capitella teleta TaxID=283909 RepID=R7TY75_CAPTE|nr:hypothetical protein CAPTEDRAFT_218575 [Capitella teleta]|eukprot:ELT96371.1 hypothetical protein CAPTEDRAFT_218575 [Capitella teleta]